MPTNHPNDPDSTDYNAAYEQFISEVAGHLLSFDYNAIANMCPYDFLDWFEESIADSKEQYETERRRMLERCPSISIYVQGLAADFADWINEDDDGFFRKLDHKYKWENGNG